MEPKSKDQLIQELRERVYALEEIESDRDAIERELKTHPPAAAAFARCQPRDHLHDQGLG